MLWERFFERLSEFADKKIYPRHRRIFDGEDIANSALFALVDGLRNERFTTVQNRDELWQILVLIASRKICNRGRHQDRGKRGSGKVRGGSFFENGDGEHVAAFLKRGQSQDMGEFERICAELLETLPNDEYKQIALYRLAGYSNQDIANKMSCAKRTIERKLNAIRTVWFETND